MDVHCKTGLEAGLLTADEAGNLGLEPVADWRTAESGDWALLDDGYVAQVLSAKATSIQEGGRPVKVVRFCHGTFFGRRSQRATSALREDLYSALGKRTNFKDPGRRLSSKERRFVQLYLQSFDVLDAFAQATDSNLASRSFRARASAYYRRANVQAAIERGVKVKLSGVGIDEEWWGEQLKRVIEDADCTRDRLAGLELVARVLGLMGSKPRRDREPTRAIEVAELEQMRAERQAGR